MAARNAPRPDGPVTIAEFARLPREDGYRVELVRGCVVREPRPGTFHGVVALNVAACIRQHVSGRGLGTLVGDAGFVLEESPPSVRGPDVAFVTAARVPADARRPGFWRVAPDLAVEVLSPSNSRAAVREKIAHYFAAGVRCVWIVDPVAETVIVREPGAPARVCRARDELPGEPVLPGLRIAVAELFRL